MKVIVAGMSKTGTKSMKAALTKLGYSVYDFPDHRFLLSEEYHRIAKIGWTTEDFRRMYENVDATVDIPALYFWDEIHKAFPDAKIILTTRDEDEWASSLERQCLKDSQILSARLWEFLSPTWVKCYKNLELLEFLSLGIAPPSRFRRKTVLNKQLAKQIYRRHNAYVMHSAPKDKLLVFKCADGWGPLCEFLGKPVPDEPFPLKNKNAELLDCEIIDYPMFRYMNLEIMISAILLASSAVLAGVVAYRYRYVCD